MLTGKRAYASACLQEEEKEETQTVSEKGRIYTTLEHETLRDAAPTKVEMRVYPR